MSLSPDLMKYWNETEAVVHKICPNAERFTRCIYTAQEPNWNDADKWESFPDGAYPLWGELGGDTQKLWLITPRGANLQHTVNYPCEVSIGTNFFIWGFDWKREGSFSSY